MTSKAGMSPLQALEARVIGALVLGVFSLVLAAPAAHATPTDPGPLRAEWWSRAAPAAHATPTDVADLVNHLRLTPSKCPAVSGLQRFNRRTELDHAAAMMNAGASLQESARATGYQAVLVKGISVRGSTDRAALEHLLASGHCPYIVDPALVDMGVHQQGTTTWVVFGGSFAPAPGMNDNALSARMLTLVNQARAQGRNCGGTWYPAVSPVTWNKALEHAARIHAEDMAKHSYFSHNSRDGTPPQARVERAGYDWRGTAENIAAGQMTPESVMAGWIGSPGHCVNLMDASYTEMGVALASNRHSQMGAYWAQVFGTPRAARGTSGGRAKQSRT